VVPFTIFFVEIELSSIKQKQIIIFGVWGLNSGPYALYLPTELNLLGQTKLFRLNCTFCPL